MPTSRPSTYGASVIVVPWISRIPSHRHPIEDPAHHTREGGGLEDGAAERAERESADGRPPRRETEVADAAERTGGEEVCPGRAARRNEGEGQRDALPTPRPCGMDRRRPTAAGTISNHRHPGGGAARLGHGRGRQ